MKIENVEISPWTYNSERTYRERDGWNLKPRVYFSPPGETILEQLFNRKYRPHLAYRDLMPEVLDKVGLNTKDSSGLIKQVKFRWSQKAGCSCPCSPGFRISVTKNIMAGPDSSNIIKEYWYEKFNNGRFDIFVDLTE